jgi:hypothetical protein
MGGAAVQVQRRTAAALTVTAAAVARQAQTNASVGRHAYGTPTPASPGTGPAIISGTLVGSIAFSTARPAALGWEARVGARSGMYPAYNGRRMTTASAEYGRYLENDMRYGPPFPWLVPAGRIARIAGPVAFRAAFTAPWRL